MKIAITGAAGLIGRSLASDLEADHEIVRLDLEPPAVIADVRDVRALTAAFAGCETVVHLAAIVSLSAGWQEILQTNIIGTQNVFEAATAAGVKRVIFASSNHAVGMRERDGGAALYAPASGVLVRNDEPYCPDSWYGVGKAFGEVLGRYYSDEFGLQVTCLRIGSIVAGDSPTDPRLGVPPWLPKLTADDARARYASTWMSQRDLARLVRSVIARDVTFAIVYGVSDNATRFWDLEPGRAIFGFWPVDGVKAKEATT
jgi:NAD+ dependent glucose-6-phosphate dehydrogenase